MCALKPVSCPQISERSVQDSWLCGCGMLSRKIVMSWIRIINWSAQIMVYQTTSFCLPVSINCIRWTQIFSQCGTLRAAQGFPTRRRMTLMMIIGRNMYSFIQHLYSASSDLSGNLRSRGLFGRNVKLKLCIFLGKRSFRWHSWKRILCAVFQVQHSQAGPQQCPLVAALSCRRRKSAASMWAILLWILNATYRSCVVVESCAECVPFRSCLCSRCRPGCKARPDYIHRCCSQERAYSTECSRRPLSWHVRSILLL